MASKPLLGLDVLPRRANNTFPSNVTARTTAGLVGTRARSAGPTRGFVFHQTLWDLHQGVIRSLCRADGWKMGVFSFICINTQKWQKARWTLDSSVFSFCNWFQKSQVKIWSSGLRCLLFFDHNQFHESIRMGGWSDSPSIPGSHLSVSSHHHHPLPHIHFLCCSLEDAGVGGVFLLFVLFGFFFLTSFFFPSAFWVL